jgi:hypothetical protein
MQVFMVYCENDISDCFYLLCIGVYGGVEGTGVDLYKEGGERGVGI